MDAALRAMNKYGKVLLCGAIHDYNVPEDKVHGMKAAAHVILKRLTIKVRRFIHEQNYSFLDVFFLS